jgi:hypothetical protein
VEIDRRAESTVLEIFPCQVDPVAARRQPCLIQRAHVAILEKYIDAHSVAANLAN